MDLSTMTTAELEELRDRLSVELSGRYAAATAPARAEQEQVEHEARLDQIAAAWHAAHGGVGTPGDPTPWSPPSGAHDVWPKGAVVAHEGKVWESLVSANAHAPGLSGWREVTSTGDAPAEWVQPSGAHDAYQVGDRVTFAGAVYESLIDGNVWSPTAHPAGWKKEDA